MTSMPGRFRNQAARVSTERSGTVERFFFAEPRFRGA
jgi:hypothetical protein